MSETITIEYKQHSEADLFMSALGPIRILPFMYHAGIPLMLMTFEQYDKLEKAGLFERYKQALSPNDTTDQERK